MPQVVRFSAREAMSSLYEAFIVLAMEPGGPPLEGLLGENAVLTVARGDQKRNLRGVIRQVEELGSTAAHRFVRLGVVPVLWTLSQRSDLRIFQQLNVLAIVREVLRVAGVYQDDGALVADASLESHATREYCVQYQETDLDFVRRLLEEEGIPFYFRHDGTAGETLVLAGDAHAYPTVATMDGAAVQVLDAGAATHAVESLKWFDERHQLQPTSVTVRDFDFSRPRTSLSPGFPARPGPRALYEFPARASLTQYDEGSRTYQTENTARLARIRQEAFQTRVHEGRGRGNVSGFGPGSVFALDGHDLPEMNREYLITEVEHTGQAWTELPEDVSSSERVLDALHDAGVDVGGGERRRGRVERYGNRFVTHRAGSIETSVPYRPERTIARPIVEGPQTAWVVGPAGEEIHTDPHGRIKVQFHWDRLGQNDDRSSCWMRVAQSSSGPGWGFTVLPRIGMEVVVSFLEGDPDRPMVTGCVNNGENGTSYPLPDMKTKSVIKTQSSPKNGGYNEIRFEDKTGSEQMYVQAERDHDTLVKHDQTVTVNRHRTKLIQGDEHNTIELNRFTHVVQDNVRHVDGNQEVEVHGGYGYTLRIDANHDTNVGQNQSLVVSGNRQKKVLGDETTTVAKNRTMTIKKRESLTVAKDRSVTVKGAASASVGKGRSVQVAQNDSLGVGGDLGVTSTNASLAAAVKASYSAGEQFVIAVGKSSITLEKERILIQSNRIEMFGEKRVIIEGGLVKVNCGEKPEPVKDTRSPLEKLLDRIKGGWQNFLAKLPKPLAGLLNKVAGPVLQGTLDALKSGKLPKLGDMMRGALQNAVGSMVGAAFQGLGGMIPGLGSIPGVGELLGRAQERVMGAVMKGADAMGMMQQGLAENPKWQRLVQTHPNVAQEAMRKVGWPVTSAALVKRPMEMIRGVGENVVFDVAARVTSRAVSGVARQMVGG